MGSVEEMNASHCAPCAPQSAWLQEVLKRAVNTMDYLGVFYERTWLTSSGAPPSLTPRLWLEVPQPFSRHASTGLTLLQAPAFL